MALKRAGEELADGMTPGQCTALPARASSLSGGLWHVVLACGMEVMEVVNRHVELRLRRAWQSDFTVRLSPADFPVAA